MSFIIKWFGTVSNAFSGTTEMTIWFLSFILRIWYITLIKLCMLKQPCISEIILTWLWYKSLFLCCCTGFDSIFLRFSESAFTRHIGLWFLFSCDISDCEIFPVLIFGRVCERLVLVLYVFRRIHQWNHLGLGLSLGKV